MTDTYKKVRLALYARDMDVVKLSVELSESKWTVYGVLRGKYGATRASVVGRRIRRRVARLLGFKYAELWGDNGSSKPRRKGPDGATR